MLNEYSFIRIFCSVHPPRSCMALRTRSGKRTGSSSLSSSPLCWRSACRPVTVSNPTSLWSAQDTDLIGVSSRHHHKHHKPKPLSGNDETPSSLKNNDTFCSQIMFLIQNQNPLHEPFLFSRITIYAFFLIAFFCCSLFLLQVKVGEGYWGTHCTAQITGEETRAGGRPWTSAQRMGHFPPAPCVSLWGRVGGGWWVWEGKLGIYIYLSE